MSHYIICPCCKEKIYLDDGLNAIFFNDIDTKDITEKYKIEFGEIGVKKFINESKKGGDC